MATLSPALQGALPKVAGAMGDALAKHAPLEHVEVEFRLGKLGQQGFDAHVPASLFHAFTRVLQSNPKWDAVQELHSVDTYTRGVRVSTMLPEKTVVAVRKQRVCNIDVAMPDSPLDVRMSVSTEVPAPVLPGPDVGRQSRVKRRTSYLHGGWQFDLTRVQRGSSPNEDSDEEEVYEVEVEMQWKCFLRQPVTYLAHQGLLLVQDLLDRTPRQQV